MYFVKMEAVLMKVSYFDHNNAHTCITRKPLKTAYCYPSCKNNRLKRAHVYNVQKDTCSRIL